jgi:hypothetical protein
MKVIALKEFKLKTSKGLLELQKGQILDLPPEKAQGLIQKGLIFPQRLLGVYDWCLNVCMLIEGQHKLCERVKPFPCWRFERESFVMGVVHE